MMEPFFIEFRLHGYAKEYARDIIYDVARKFKVKGVTKVKAVPHIALYGGSETNNIRRVVSAVEKIGRRYTLVPFRIKGFDYFDNKVNKVIFLDIDPSPMLIELRWELAQALAKISSPKPWDIKRKFEFHSTIAFKDIDSKFKRIWDYIKSNEQPNINQYLLRITIIGKHSKILYEYDLILKRLLNRREALSRHWWRKTIAKFRELQGLPPEEHVSVFNKLVTFFRNLL